LAVDSAAPSGLCWWVGRFFQGLTPLATDDRRSAAKARAVRRLRLDCRLELCALETNWVREPARRGMVLMIVAVVVVLLSLAGLSFVVNLQTEHKAARVQGQRLQLGHVVESGAATVQAFCRQPWAVQQQAGGSWDNAAWFRDVLVLDDESTKRRGQFSVLASPADDGEGGQMRFGLQNESARLNLGALVRWEQREPGAGQRALLALPGMTAMLADAILDWLDADATARPFGAEADYYQGRGLPYEPRNGVPQCLEELLLIRDVTRPLVFGAEPNWAADFGSAGDEAASRPAFPGSGGSSQPWAALLTVCSAERNETFDGQPRIPVNGEDLGELHRRLAAVLDPSWADFVVLYRQYGPYRETVGIGPATPAPETPPPGAPTVDLSVPAKVRIESLLDLVGAKVRPEVSPPAAPAVVASPWPADPAALRESLPKLLDAVTIGEEPVIEGLINVNLAPRSVLLAVPGIDVTLADRIVATRGAHGSPAEAGRQVPTWLLAEGLVDLPAMKALGPYLTCRGDVVRAHIAGTFQPAGPAQGVEVVIDAAHVPPRQIYRKEWAISGRTAPQ
jgi:hypothetical protein